MPNEQDLFAAEKSPRTLQEDENLAGHHQSKNKMSASTRGRFHRGHASSAHNQEIITRTQLRKVYTKDAFHDKKRSVHGLQISAAPPGTSHPEFNMYKLAADQGSQASFDPPYFAC